MDDFDNRLSVSSEDEKLSVRVDWAPAFELLMSLSRFLDPSSRSSHDLGTPWLKAVQHQLPSESLHLFQKKSATRAFREHECDLILLLALASPRPARDAAHFIDWFSQLSAGGAYEALAPYAPEPGPRLPRDFVGWRDPILDMLGTWYSTYFRQTDPHILELLSDEASELRQRVGTVPPNLLIEEVTNGLVVEPSAMTPNITLVPQYHHRPYNHMIAIQDGILILYPTERAPTADDAPPTRLVHLAHALSDESRLRILRFLADRPCSLTEVARFAGLSQPTVHHHLAQLRAAGLVRVHCDRVNVCLPGRYSLRPHALEQLSEQLGAYLFSGGPSSEVAANHEHLALSSRAH